MTGNRIPSQDELQKVVDGFRWYHEIAVSPYIKTKPSPRYDVSWDLIEHGMAKMDLRGKTVLDVGTRDGKYAFEAERLGASDVQAIDTDVSKGALWLAKHFLSRVNFYEKSVYDISDDFAWDVIFAFGLIYHLRYPMKALRKLVSRLVPNGTLYMETSLFVGGDCEALPMLHCPVRKSPYEQTSCSFFNLEGLKETLWSFGCTIKSHEFHLSEDNPRNIMHVRRAWIEAEKTHDMPEDLRRYWESTHTSHD